MNLIKKLFVYAVVFATIVTMSLPAGIAVAATNVAAGDLIKSNVSPAVYYYNGSERFAFPNPSVYFSWYEDYKTVKTLTADELAAITYNGKLVTMRPGTKMVKIESDPKVYAVEPGGKLRSIPSEAVATTLYGNNWARMVSDVSDAFWFWYDKTNTTPLSDKHTTGSLVKYANSNNVYYIDGTSKRLVSEAGMTANKFDMDYVLTIADTITYTDGTQVTGAEEGLFPIASGTTTAPATLGALSVALSASNPVSATVISDSVETAQSMVPFLAVNLTASSAGDVKVTKMIFERTGISADEDVPNLYLFDGTTKLSDAGSISTKVLTFNDTDSYGIITIPAGTTKTIMLKGDLKLALGASKQIGFNLTSVVSNAASTVASYPVVGNLMVTASATDLGYAKMGTTAIPTDDTDVNSNEKDFEAFKVVLTANDQDMQLEGLRLTQIGSVSNGDLTNFKLQVGGTTLATSELNGNNELYFDLSATPYVLTKGNSKTFSLRVDIAKGSTRTFQFAVQNSSDIVMKDKGYNVYTQTFKDGSLTWSALKSAYHYTISSGTLSTTKDNTSPSGTIVTNATNVKLATFKFEATGEDVKVKSLDLQAYSAASAVNSGVQNVKVYYDGVQVGNTKNLTVGSATTTASVNFSFGSSMVLPAGTPKLVEIYADTKTAAGATLGSTGSIQVNILAGTDAQGVVSLNTVTVGAVSGNALALSTSALSMAKNASFGSNYLTSPASAAKIASFTMTAGATEGIAVDNIYISGVTSGQISNLTLKYGDTVLATKPTLPSSGTTTIGMGSNLSLAAGQSKIIDVYADVKSGITSYAVTTVVAGDGTTNITNTSAVSTGAPLQTMTIAAGSVTVSAASSKPDADIVIGAMTSLVNAVEFTALNEAMTITNLRITSAGTAGAVAAVVLEYPKEDGTTGTATGYLDGSGYATFSNLAMYVPKNGTAVLSIKAQLSSLLDSSTNLSGSTVILTVPDLSANTTPSIFTILGKTSGTSLYATGTASAMTGSTMILRATRPTITIVALPSTLLTDGTQVLSKFKIAADATNDISWQKIVFSYTSSTGVSVTDNTINLYKEGSSTKLFTADTLDLTPATKIITFIATNEQTITKGTSQVYELKGDITGSASDTSFSTRIGGTNAAAGAVTTSIYSDVTTTEGRFLWSDRSAAPHVSGSADWCDSNYVKSLPTDSQTLTRN